MVRVKKIFILVGIAGLLVAGCRPSIPNIDSQGSTIVAFGDSITFGVGAPPQSSYPALLSERLGIEVINAGIPGETSTEGFARLSEVLELDPWVVIVEFGGNDLLQRRPLKETASSLRGILEELLAAGIVPVLVEIHGPFGGEMEELFEDLSSSYEIPLIEDVLPKILRTPRLKSDPIHPNAEGYEMFAEEVGDLLEELLEQREELP